ncbi:hypothetical protein [Deinococcus sp. NW-56]|uniref:phage NrS-1 polymerase family protein n=1 Tax=Deinococcus sp. NW-56 TaxID=2080419 RepID=UPI000CF4706F|nr:hypothetical protein [Deinococcus sp. NW-56]
MTGRLPTAWQLEAALPPEVLALRWLPWLARRRPGGGVGKVPVRPHGGQLMPVDYRRAGWPWPQALRLAEDHLASGLGVVLEPGLVVLDLDGPLTPGCRARVARMEGYAEQSPSGHGLHVWLRGALPRSRRESGTEWLAHGYVTVTGRTLSGRPRTLGSLSQAQAVMGAGHESRLTPAPEAMAPQPHLLPDSEVLARLRRARNGARALRLLAGHWQEAGYSSPSEADFAAVRLLAFYTRDLTQLQRLLRASGLARAKYRQPGYLTRTITRAVALGGPTWCPQRGGT